MDLDELFEGKSKHSARGGSSILDELAEDLRRMTKSDVLVDEAEKGASS